MKNLSPEKFLLLRQNASAKALISSSSTYTFDQLRQKVLATASYLKSQQISSGNRVGILGKNDFDFVINILALWQLSAVPVPLNLRLMDKEIDEQLNLANCSTILVQNELHKKVISKTKKVIKYPIKINDDSTFSRKDELDAKRSCSNYFYFRFYE